MTRTPLPNLRSNVTRTVHWDGHEFTVTIGLDPVTWQPAEVFADTAKGGQMHVTIADACVWASLLLQFGATPEDLRRSLGEVPVLGAPKGTVGPASPLGAIAESIAAEVAMTVSHPGDDAGIRVGGSDSPMAMQSTLAKQEGPDAALGLPVAKAPAESRGCPAAGAAKPMFGAVKGKRRT